MEHSSQIMKSLLGSVVITTAKEYSWMLTLLVITALAYTQLRQKRPNLSHIPILRKELGGIDALRAEYAKRGFEMLEEGYHKPLLMIMAQFKNSAFLVFGINGPFVFLGLEQMDELNILPDTIVDPEDIHRENLAVKYTKAVEPDPILLHSLRADLSPKLGELNEAIAVEVDRALRDGLPECEDWTSVNLYSKLLRIITIASTRVFIGEELCYNEEWLQTAANYAVHLGTGSRTIRKWRPWLRPIVYRFLPEIQTIYKDRQTALRLLKPIIQARRESETLGHQKPNDMLQWMMDQRIRKHSRDRDYEYLADVQLLLTFVGIHTTTASSTNLFYDLGAMPEYSKIIREEVREELAKNEWRWDGRLMRALKKTDSVMKESQRHNPLSRALWTRRILRDTTLKDGTFLPQGCTVSANTWMINHDEDVMGDATTNEFDGLRYYRSGLDQAGGQVKEAAGKHQFVSISKRSMMFGYGRHACPGRFFAGNEIKLIAAKILRDFDLKLDGPERYANPRWEASNIPDASKMVLLKRRSETEI